MPSLTVATLTDEELLNLMLALRLGCGRSKTAFKRRRELWYCFGFRVLKTEADLRGLPSPTGPVHGGDLPPGPPAL